MVYSSVIADESVAELSCPGHVLQMTAGSWLAIVALARKAQSDAPRLGMGKATATVSETRSLKRGVLDVIDIAATSVRDRLGERIMDHDADALFQLAVFLDTAERKGGFRVEIVALPAGLPAMLMCSTSGEVS